MRILFFIAILNATVNMASAELHNLHCACVGSKTPSHQDALEIRRAFPNDELVMRFVFDEQTYYIVVRNHKIYRILSGWKIGNADEHVWAVLDPEGRILEWLFFPQGRRVTAPDANGVDDGDVILNEIESMIGSRLSGQWKVFCSRVRLNLAALDAVSKATP